VHHAPTWLLTKSVEAFVKDVVLVADKSSAGACVDLRDNQARIQVREACEGGDAEL